MTKSMHKRRAKPKNVLSNAVRLGTHLPSAIELLQRSISTVMAKISQGEIYRGPRPRPLPQYFTGFSMKFERGQYGGVLDTTRQPPLDLSFCPHGVYLTLFQKTSVHALFHEGHNDHVPSPGAATLASLENSKIGSRFDKVSPIRPIRVLMEA